MQREESASLCFSLLGSDTFMHRYVLPLHYIIHDFILPASVNTQTAALKTFLRTSVLFTRTMSLCWFVSQISCYCVSFVRQHSESCGCGTTTPQGCESAAVVRGLFSYHSTYPQILGKSLVS